ncbi:hypothetical protein HPB51_019896 [Rhipicephalus microplus]|uniref:PIN domain-containing protein n=1 Tax=Rhipicephalus microplus TaxID=6941 RepID=A0A9J6E3J6_RHIMP|nr:hypothetical protein HPB51_019896 [Rhipicephalus microplus]
MAKVKATQKAAKMKRMISLRDQRLKEKDRLPPKKKKKEDPHAIKVSEAILIDTNFINFAIKNKLDVIQSMMDCLYAKCIPYVTDCVIGELEKLGSKYRVALRIAKDPRFVRLPCMHRGTYADDCLVERSHSAQVLHRGHVRQRPETSDTQGARCPHHVHIPEAELQVVPEPPPLSSCTNCLEVIDLDRFYKGLVMKLFDKLFAALWPGENLRQYGKGLLHYLANEDLGEGVRSGAGNVWLRRVEGHVEDRLVELLAMRGDLLHARLVVQVPQPD